MLRLSLVCGFLAFSQLTTARRDVGPCPNRSVKANFEMSQYLGLWYEVQRSKVSFEEGLACVESTWSPSPKTGHAYMRNIGIAVTNSKPIPQTIQGEAIAQKKDAAKLYILLEAIVSPANYWILDTDYYNYAVVSSCANQGLFHEEIAWVFSRNRTGLGANAQVAVDQVLAKNKFEPKDFVHTAQTKCVN